MAKVLIEGNAGSLLSQLLQGRLRSHRESERFGGRAQARSAADHLAERAPFPREKEGPGAGLVARQARFSSRPGPLGRYEPNLPAWW